ncbi:uncharacterized protein LOC135338110 isoform X2 [Halichondria panicea]|uniref:uncharacterized protein LOC135338110 isoform X2 n=1 Tax=Halichondria panicea TaxID=6063 RepID=UPI00312B63BD
MEEVDRSIKSAWLARHLMRARKYEAQKIAWKIFFLERRDINDFGRADLEAKISQACKLLFSLRRVRIKSLAAELANRSKFISLYDDTIAQNLKHFSSNEEIAKQIILKSKLSDKTLRILHKYHISTTHKQLQSSEASCKPEHTVKHPATARQRERNPKRTAPTRKMRGQGTNGKSSVVSRRPSTLDSVFIGSLSQSSKGVDKPSRKKPAQKNRLGQRSRQQQAESVYGGAARHLKGTKHTHSSSGKSRKPLNKGRSYKPIQTHYTKKTPPTNKQPQGSEQLHPSWAASKKRKEMENRILKPQGQKIIFADSD